jgi:hypothetical protein
MRTRSPIVLGAAFSMLMAVTLPSVAASAKVAYATALSHGEIAALRTRLARLRERHQEGSALLGRLREDRELPTQRPLAERATTVLRLHAIIGRLLSGMQTCLHRRDPKLHALTTRLRPELEGYVQAVKDLAKEAQRAHAGPIVALARELAQVADAFQRENASFASAYQQATTDAATETLPAVDLTADVAVRPEAYQLTPRPAPRSGDAGPPAKPAPPNEEGDDAERPTGAGELE